MTSLLEQLRLHRTHAQKGQGETDQALPCKKKGCACARTRGHGRGRLQPVLHVALRVVAAAQHLAARRHRLVGQVLEQVVQQARVAFALTRRVRESRTQAEK